MQLSKASQRADQLQESLGTELRTVTYKFSQQLEQRDQQLLRVAVLETTQAIEPLLIQFSEKIVEHGRHKGSKNKKTLQKEKEKETAAAADKTANEKSAQEQQQNQKKSQASALLEMLSRRLDKKGDSDDSSSEDDDRSRPPRKNNQDSESESESESEEEEEEGNRQPCKCCRPYFLQIHS